MKTLIVFATVIIYGISGGIVYASPSFVATGSSNPTAPATTQQSKTDVKGVQAWRNRGEGIVPKSYHVVRKVQRCKTTPPSLFYMQVVSPKKNYKVSKLEATCPAGGGKASINTEVIVQQKQAQQSLVKRLSSGIKSFLVTPAKDSFASKKLTLIKSTVICPFNPTNVRNNIVTFLVDDTGKKLITKCGEPKEKSNDDKAKDIKDIGNGANNGEGVSGAGSQQANGTNQEEIGTQQSALDKAKQDALRQADAMKAQQQVGQGGYAAAGQGQQGGGMGQGSQYGGGYGGGYGGAGQSAEAQRLQDAYNKKLEEIKLAGNPNSTSTSDVAISSYGETESDEEDFKDPWDDNNEDAYDGGSDDEYAGTTEEQAKKTNTPELDTDTVDEPKQLMEYAEPQTDWSEYYSPDGDDDALREFFMKDGELESVGVPLIAEDDSLASGDINNKANWDTQELDGGILTFEELEKMGIHVGSNLPELAQPVSVEQWDSMTLAEKLKYSENDSAWYQDLTPEQVQEYEVERRSWFYRWFVGWYWVPLANFFNPSAKYSM